MNSRGVFSSTKIGRLIATLDPRLLLMFAVRVLYSKTGPQSSFVSRDEDRERFASTLTENARADW